jgi:iron complex transport system ATP-binding protein
MLNAQDISFGIHGKNILHATNVSFLPGKFYAIMGANGAGKSTLLRILAGSERPSSGQVILKEKPLSDYGEKDLAKQRAVLSQHYHISFPITVGEVVMMGRYPYFGNAPSVHDRAICRQSMELMQVLHFTERDYNTLSGGEAQKVMMSRVLAQVWEATGNNRKILFLDEPVSHLDIRFQHQLMLVAKTFCTQHLTVIAVLHDMNLALKYADSLLLMKNGKLIYNIIPDQLNETILEETFDIPIKMHRHEETMLVYTP